MLSYAVAAATALQPERIVVVVGHRPRRGGGPWTRSRRTCGRWCRSEQLRHRVRRQCALDRLGDAERGGGGHHGRRPDAGRRHPAALLARTGRRGGGHPADRRGARPHRLRADHPRPARGRGIVEHKDADAEQLAITEINSGIYVFDADCPARRRWPSRHRQRPGRAATSPTCWPGPARRPGVVGATSPTTCGRPRASTTGSSWPA